MFRLDTPACHHTRDFHHEFSESSKVLKQPHFALLHYDLSSSCRRMAHLMRFDLNLPSLESHLANAQRTRSIASKSNVKRSLKRVYSMSLAVSQINALLPVLILSGIQTMHKPDRARNSFQNSLVIRSSKLQTPRVQEQPSASVRSAICNSTTCREGPCRRSTPLHLQSKSKVSRPINLKRASSCRPADSAGMEMGRYS
jgi:hypothetical protein